MIDAVHAVKEGEIRLKVACKVFEVKRSTLQKRVQEIVSVKSHGSGRPTVLPKAVENEMARCLRVGG